MRSALLAIWLGGCSIAIGGPDATRAPRVRPSCDTGKAMVKVDGAAAVGLGVLGLAMIPASGGVASFFIVGGALYAASALRGNHVVERCREDFQRFDQEIALAQPPLVVPSEPAQAIAAPTPTRPAPAVAAQAVAAPAITASPEATPAKTPDDPFHVAVGEASPATTFTLPSTRAPVTPTTSPWRDFWREVP